MKTVAIVVPTYNERENIEQLVQQIEEVLEKHRIKGNIIIVDDNSPDKTGELAEQLAQKYDNISVLHRPVRLGIGRAFKDGFKQALDLKREIIFEMDADLSHDPKYIPNFLKKINEGYDVVIGSRHMLGGGIKGWSLDRHMVSWGANWLAKTILKLKVTDVTSGYRAFNAKVLKTVDLPKIKSNGYAFQVEMIHKCVKAGFNVGEIPIFFVNRRAGRSKLGSREILRFAKTVLSLTQR